MGQESDENVNPSPATERPDHEAVQVKVLKVDIQDTRSQIGDTLQALEERLSPANLAADAAAAAKARASHTMEHMMTTASEKMNDLAERTRETAQGVVDSVRDNPWPAVVVGAGLGYLLYRRFGASGLGREAGFNRRYDDARASVRTFETGSAQRVIRDARRGASSAAALTGQMMRDNPLAFGIAAMAIGAAIGLSAPETETENQWLGETRDAVVDRARELAVNVTSAGVPGTE